MGYETRADSDQAALGWLQGRLQELRGELQIKERAAEAFQAQSGLLTSGGVPLTERLISDAQTAVLQARTDLADATARRAQADQLDRTDSGEALGSVLNSAEIRDLRQREADLLRRQAELQTTLGDRHPDVQSVRAELENVRAQRVEANQRIRQ